MSDNILLQTIQKESRQLLNTLTFREKKFQTSPISCRVRKIVIHAKNFRKSAKIRRQEKWYRSKNHVNCVELINDKIMPLYSYIPYLDPDINENQKKSFSGHIIDTDDEVESLHFENDTPKLLQRTTADTFTKKVNENLRNINNRMTDLLQDGLGGVDNICKQVRNLLGDNNQVPTEKYRENRSRRDIYDYREEERYDTPDPSQETIFSRNREKEENLQEIYHNNNNSVFAMQEKVIAKGDSLSTSPKRDNSCSRPNSRSVKPKKSDLKSTRLSSKSLVTTDKTSLNKKSSDKIKSKTKKKTTEAEPKPVVGETCAKKRLGQIERDYQKVVENLGMVERMMASVNERLMNQKKERTSVDTVSSKEKTAEHPKSTKKTSKPTNKKVQPSVTKQKSIGENLPQKEITSSEIKEDKQIGEKKSEKLPKEVNKRRKKETKDLNKSEDFQEKISQKETEEKRVAQEIIKQMKSIEKINNSSNSKKVEENRQAELLKALNPLSRITINDSLSDIDALIDNAVMELGNLVSSDFKISQNSSDASFKLTTEDGGQNLYDECNSVTSSSTRSGSANALLGEDSDKFDISQSFQELKESYVQKIKQEANGRKKKSKKSEAENPPQVQTKNSYDRAHEDIFIDSSWNKLDQISFECTYSADTTRNSNNSIDSSMSQQGNPLEKDSLKSIKQTSQQSRNLKNAQEDRTEKSNSAMEALLRTKMEITSREDQSEEMITISLPSAKQRKQCGKKPGDFAHEITNIDTRQLGDDTVQITVTLKGNEEAKKEEKSSFDKNEQTLDQTISDSELAEYPNDFEVETKQERTPSKQQKKIKSKDQKITRTCTQEKVKAEGGEAEEGIIIDVYKRKNIEGISSNTRTKSKQKKVNERKPKKFIDGSQFGPDDIKEIKKMEGKFDECSSYSSFLSFEDSMFWSKEDEENQGVKPIDPMKQVSIVCKRLISDLVVEEQTISLQEMMDGCFNATLIQSLVLRHRRPRSVRIHTPIQDPDLRSIVPEVHRKKAIPDLHERMEYQIRQTDSFDGFLNLMNKNRRKALIKQAEKQDHNVRCQMRTCFRKRYPFRVVTASVPAGYDSRFKDKKEPERKYINSLWFSPKDFKLRRNSRIFNRKRMEMYCQSLNKGPVISKCKCGEAASRESKKFEKASNYSILVRSGTPLGRRPNTPRRWIHLRPSTPAGGISHRPRLHHCDILDDLTLKDLAPFKSEYPRNDERRLPESLEGSLLYKLACGGQKGDADGTLMELIAPKLTCAQENCKMCKCKSKIDKKRPRKTKSPKKSGDDSSVTSTKTELQNLNSKAATQLLIQNIGEIKSKKSSTKYQASEKNINKNKETKTKQSVKSLRKNSRKALVLDSKSTMHQRMEENMVKRIFQNRNVTITDFVPKFTPLQRMAFKDIDHFQKILNVPELYSRPSTRRSNITKLFPYINDPDNKVFQNITVLPVKVFYNFEPLKDASEKDKQEVPASDRFFPRGNQPINIASLSETDELEVSTVECRRPSTADDKVTKKKMVARRRMGTPKSPTFGSRQNPNKFTNVPPNPTGPSSPITYPLDISYSRKSKEIIGVNQETLNNSKNSPRRSRFKRSSSLGKSTESDNPVSQVLVRRSGNPNPWKPASRRPRTPKTPPLPKLPTRIRSKEKSSMQQLSPYKTFSTGWISPRQHMKLPQKTFEKCFSDGLKPVQEPKDQHQTQTVVNKDKKIRFELSPSKNFYDINVTETKPHITRAPTHKCRPLSPSQRVMIDHLHMLRNRNTRLQGNIQKAINIIEEKMVDVLSTNDQTYKKKTIDRMEKEINKVLKMINEQNCIINKKKDNTSETAHSDIQKSISKTDAIRCISVASKQTAEEESQTNTKALITHTVGLKMPRPPRKRSISRVLKFHYRPSTVEEEKSYDLAEETPLFRINEGEVSDEEVPICKSENETKIGEETEAKIEREELYPSPIASEEGAPLCPILRCPTPQTSCTKLSRKTKKMLRRMSREAFGKFADVVRTKTRLIIDMTERIDMDDTNLLPNPKVTSALPAILARSTNLPVITTIHQPRASDLMSTTVSSIVSVHQTPIEKFWKASADALSGTTTEISEFANGCADRSLTSFSESESYTWRKIEQSQPMGLECSTCSLKRKISHDLTPFMRALNNLKGGRLFEKRHQLLPIEETSPNFRKMMSFLERLSKVKESLNQTTTRDVQLMWNPEKRCSFHSSIAGTKKLNFMKNTKAISEHSMIQYPATSISELFSQIKIEENPSETIGDIIKEPREKPQNDEERQQTIIETSDDAAKEVKDSYKLDSGVAQEIKQHCKLVLSEVQLISICSSKNMIKKYKKRTSFSSDYKEPRKIPMDDRYSDFLKLFYFIFYTMVYFCMTAMNFSC